MFNSIASFDTPIVAVPEEIVKRRFKLKIEKSSAFDKFFMNSGWTSSTVRKFVLNYSIATEFVWRRDRLSVYFMQNDGTQQREKNGNGEGK